MSSTATKDSILASHIAAELTGLADVLTALDQESWGISSLCTGWSLREVVAHLTLPARRSNPAVLAGLAFCGFRWHAFADKAAHRDAGISTSKLLADLRSTRLAAWRPPGGGPEGALVHAVVHALDITVPLGVSRPSDSEKVRLVLDALVAPTSLKHFGVDLDGLELRADDIPWLHGNGRRVTADSEAIVLLLSGRTPLPG